MKKILFLILLFCFGAKADAQLPELGWTKEQVNKFMEGKYKYKYTTAFHSVEGSSDILSFAPVTLYGINGTLSISYCGEDVCDIDWYRGTHIFTPDSGWEDKLMQKELDSTLSSSQIELFVNSISKELGEPSDKSFEHCEGKPCSYYKWRRPAKKQGHELEIGPDSRLLYSFGFRWGSKWK